MLPGGIIRPVQSVKKAVNRQNAFITVEQLLQITVIASQCEYWRCNPFTHRKSACCARHFDLLRKPHSIVPMYADECGLLVLATSLTSASLSKICFSTGCTGRNYPSGFLIENMHRIFSCSRQKEGTEEACSHRNQSRCVSWLPLPELD